MDALAVRFPKNQEPEREIQGCTRLSIPADHIDFIVGEVKGGPGPVNFNFPFRGNARAIRTVLRRFGAFEDSEVERVVMAVPALLDPTKLQNAKEFPVMDVAMFANPGLSVPAKLRFVPFAAEQTRPNGQARPYVFADDLIEFVWKCLKPDRRRPLSDDNYNYELWGPQFMTMVRHFKNCNRDACTVEDLYGAYGV